MERNGNKRKGMSEKDMSDFSKEFDSVLQRLFHKEITVDEYCKMADDIMLAYTSIKWPLHCPESYAKVSWSSSSDEEWEEYRDN